MLTDAVTGWHPALAMEASSGGVSLPHRERRDDEARERLMARIRAEFSEMPCLRLTEAQSARLFGVPRDACERVLAALEREGTLSRGPDGRYRIRAGQ